MLCATHHPVATQPAIVALTQPADQHSPIKGAPAHGTSVLKPVPSFCFCFCFSFSNPSPLPTPSTRNPTKIRKKKKRPHHRYSPLNHSPQTTTNNVSLIGQYTCPPHFILAPDIYDLTRRPPTDRRQHCLKVCSSPASSSSTHHTPSTSPRPPPYLFRDGSVPQAP